MWRFSILIVSLALALPGQAQLLQAQTAEPGLPATQRGEPLVLRSAANENQAAKAVDEAIDRLRGEMRAVADAALARAQRREAYHQLYIRHASTLGAGPAASSRQPPATVEEAVERLETLIYEVALEAAPDDASRERIRTSAPSHVVLESSQAGAADKAPPRAPVLVLRDPESTAPWWGQARLDPEALAVEEIAESPEEQLEPQEENLQTPPQEKAEFDLPVAVLADEKTTVEMHDDQTILRGVTSETGALVLFDRLDLWAGGSVQYDAYSYDGLLNARRDGDSESDADTRRAEVILRATLGLFGEAKFQYDLDAEIWRDLYIRRVDDERGLQLTLGNMTEPMSQEAILGNKFSVAMEQSAPTSVFGSWSGLGGRINKWFDLEPGQRYGLYAEEVESYVTTSFGIFGQDIENSSDTDVAATGRVTFGRQRYGGSFHTGISVTLRDGDFTRIDPRPGIQNTDRILLSEFDADTAAIVGVEALLSRGPLHVSAEGFAASYTGGKEDALGGGAFVEMGYYLTGEERSYRPRWGLWAPLQVGARNIFEVFAKASLTYGDADDDPDNTLQVYTIGASWYRNKFRSSVNFLYTRVDRQRFDEDDGLGASMRVQYLF